MIHNIVKYLVQTRIRLWDIKIKNFKPESCPDDLLEIYYFYISQIKSSLDNIFYKVVYHNNTSCSTGCILLYYLTTYAMETSLLWKTVQTTIKKSSKLTKKITHTDDMMIQNLVKYLVQTRLRLWDKKIKKFQATKLSIWFVRNLLFLYLTT